MEIGVQVELELLTHVGMEILHPHALLTKLLHYNVQTLNHAQTWQLDLQL
jgi:hypothetical protein